MALSNLSCNSRKTPLFGRYNIWVSEVREIDEKRHLEWKIYRKMIKEGLHEEDQWRQQMADKIRQQEDLLMTLETAETSRMSGDSDERQHKGRDSAMKKRLVLATEIVLTFVMNKVKFMGTIKNARHRLLSYFCL